ncbi:hypothetical protein OEA41_010771 [Lepraria neglecta]|uniref:Uncharacterized protein n=1 Tax=Lepraria neglecta TaxID=209136 RepID=A0AAD9YX75_9LECA|nr:hypothetical protein OEA41_010771 [Lepraria neglecta]
MASPILVATLQSTFLALCSLLIARFLTKADPPPNIPALLIFTLLSTPPNFLWQQWMESKFPGYKVQKVEVDDGGNGVEVEERLNVRNTLVKFGLDQTVGAVVNVGAYIGGTRLLRGVPAGACWDAVKEQMWPIMKAGYKLWPTVNLIQHVFIPVEKKTVPVLLFLMVIALTLWWFNEGSEELDFVKLGAAGLRKEFLNKRIYDYQFDPATNPKIHIHLWVYFDITIENTTSLLLALRNAPEPETSTSAYASSEVPTSLSSAGHRHFHFHPISSNEKPAPAVSLLAQVDDQEHINLPSPLPWFRYALMIWTRIKNTIGPVGSTYYEHPWMFSSYLPDVLVLNIGSSDDASFHAYETEYNKTLWDLSERFGTKYVSLIKAIRNLAYPKHSSIIQSERAGTTGIVPSTAPASIPIVVMRPLRGQLEQATQNAVTKLRADGDKAVFWLDPDIEDSQIADFFLDETVTPAKWRLIEQGNQRVAIFLHTHVCRYLAGAEEKCAFLPHEVYQGKGLDQEEARFDKYIEDEKERKLKKLFWENEGGRHGGSACGLTWGEV